MNWKEVLRDDGDDDDDDDDDDDAPEVPMTELNLGPGPPRTVRQASFRFFPKICGARGSLNDPPL